MNVINFDTARTRIEQDRLLEQMGALLAQGIPLPKDINPELERLIRQCQIAMDCLATGQDEPLDCFLEQLAAWSNRDK